MFESVTAGFTDADLAALPALLTVLERGVDRAARIDRIRAAEAAQGALAAVIIRETAAFAEATRAEHRAAGIRAERAEQGVAAEIALARRMSLSAAQGRVSAAKLITTELPATLGELAAGRTTEARVLTVARVAGALDSEDRAAVDAAIAPRLAGLGDRAVQREMDRLAYECDREGFIARKASAAADRRVSLRPAPDAMVWVSALAPVVQGVAVYAALRKHADMVRGRGDERTLGQVMADTWWSGSPGSRTPPTSRSPWGWS